MGEKKLLDELLAQEKELVFKTFSNDDAHALGEMLYNGAKEEGLAIAMDVTRHGQVLYHAALDGTAPDNDQWMLHKIKVVNRFNHSSFYVGQKLIDAGKTIEEECLISSMDYAAHGGSFPIIVENVGVVGTVTVSGLPDYEDHAFVVKTIRKFIAKKK